MHRIKYLLATAILILVPSLLFSDTAAIRQLLSDVKVSYLYDKKEAPDWPFLYYLENELGAEVSLISLTPGPAFSCDSVKSDEYALTAYDFNGIDTSAAEYGGVISTMYGEFIPDIVIFSGDSSGKEIRRFESYLHNVKHDTAAIYKISKFYRKAALPDSGAVNFARLLYLRSHLDAIAKFAGSVMKHPDVIDDNRVYSTYRPEGIAATGAGSDALLSGIPMPKLMPFARKNIANLYDIGTVEGNIENYLNYLKQALAEQEGKRTESLLTALGLLKKIERIYLSEKEASSKSIFGRYLAGAMAKLTKAIFDDAGIDFDGETSIVETTEGTKVKFRSDVYNDGPYPIEFGQVRFKPYWSDTAMTLDTGAAEILPHNILTREYLVPVQEFQLETLQPESLLFTGQVQLKNNPMAFRYGLKTKIKLPLKIEFAPRFYVMKPFPKLQVDRLVQSFQLGLSIQKPSSYTGEISLKISSAPGITIGVYPKVISLKDGENLVHVDVPMAVGSSLGSERKRITATISRGGKFLTSDTAFFRLAEYGIKENLKVALLPDDSGRLEDIFRMTGVNYRTISDHYLLSGDLDFFDVILLGEGCVGEYPSLFKAKERFGKFVEYGGTLLVFGQPARGLDDILPAPILCGEAYLGGKEVAVEKVTHTILNRPYTVSDQELLKGFRTEYRSYPAEFAGADNIMVFKGKGSLLGEKKAGHGKIIYCGLPLVGMFANLDTEAVKLLSNLLNYCVR
ncbi:hypothetical protein TRIP_C20507 [Candidatus Zixiibacteriota bacterium]|nr:hypothetical protein TRIP_C20507 [candidate division Zixibacteria bacterium]